MNAVEVHSLQFDYGKRTALKNVSFSVRTGEMFGIVGPNGGGKSTTFKILSGLLKQKSGSISITGSKGIVFQSPALDKKLTVYKNLLQQGYLYGMKGKLLKDTAHDYLKKFNLLDRKNDRVETLSGGLKRRLEIAKALLHKPNLLILDEPTTGLDPLARREVWNHLKHLQKIEGLTILVTTHLLDEADSCDRVVFLDQGEIVLNGSPKDLKALVGGDIISVKTRHPETLKQAIEKKFGTLVSQIDQELRIQKKGGHEFIPSLVTEFSDQIESITLGKPTLEDLFIQKTGHRL